MNHDVKTENPEPLRTQMNIAMTMLTEIFPGKNVTFFMCEFNDESPERRMYYASNGQKPEVMKALQDYINAHQNPG